jgi:hypothetical protein
MLPPAKYFSIDLLSDNFAPLKIFLFSCILDFSLIFFVGLFFATPEQLLLYMQITPPSGISIPEVCTQWWHTEYYAEYQREEPPVEVPQKLKPTKAEEYRRSVELFALKWRWPDYYDYVVNTPDFEPEPGYPPIEKPHVTKLVAYCKYDPSLPSFERIKIEGEAPGWHWYVHYGTLALVVFKIGSHFLL